MITSAFSITSVIQPRQVTTLPSSSFSCSRVGCLKINLLFIYLLLFQAGSVCCWPIVHVKPSTPSPCTPFGSSKRRILVPGTTSQSTSREAVCLRAPSLSLRSSPSLFAPVLFSCSLLLVSAMSLSWYISEAIWRWLIHAYSLAYRLFTYYCRNIAATKSTR